MCIPFFVALNKSCDKQSCGKMQKPNKRKKNNKKEKLGYLVYIRLNLRFEVGYDGVHETSI